MKIIPRNDKVIVQRLEGPKMSKGGIALPDNMKETAKASHGKIVAVGPGNMKTEDLIEGLNHAPDFDRRMCDLKIDQTILFGKFTGWDCEHDGEKYVVLSENDILAIVEESK